MALLTIAVPTYNRADKLARTLRSICTQIQSCPNLVDEVKIVVSDNGSTDTTPNVLTRFDAGPVSFRFFRQNDNLGLDRNMRFLYQACGSDYVWFFSDDDNLFLGAIGKVYDALVTHAPDALLFSFVQPVGSTKRTFDFKDNLTVICEPEQMIELLARSPKLSIYVLKRIDLDARDEATLQPFIGSDYDFIAVSYTILEKSVFPKLCVISEPLAGCDKDFNYVRFRPETWGNRWIVFTHPFVRRHAPHLEAAEQRRSYYHQIQALFAAKVGSLIPEDAGSYDECIVVLRFHPEWLLINPKCFLRFILLKLNLARYWGRYLSRSRSRN